MAKAASKKETTEVTTNASGEKVEQPSSEKQTVYLTPDGTKMVIYQIDEENNIVFAGEHGKPSKWFPKAVADQWVEQK